MSWTQKSRNGYLIATETLALTTGQTTATDSSVIDFINPGVDFIIGTLPSTALSTTGVDVDIKVSDESAGTFGILKADLATADAKSLKYTTYDISANGQAPYYKVSLLPDGAMKSATVAVTVIVPPKIANAQYV